MNQSEVPAITCNLLKEWEKLLQVQDAIISYGFGFLFR